MLTFTQRKQMAAKLCGISYAEPEMDIIVANINLADKMFQNAASRPWTIREQAFDIENQKQYYRLPPNFVRVSDVRCKQAENSNVVVPLTEVHSELEWNRLNAIPYSGMYPTHFFIKGHNEIGLFPTPASDVSDGLIITYEPRVNDMGVEDVSFYASVEQGDTAITAIVQNNETIFQPYMTTNWYAYRTDGTDGNYYKIESVEDGTHATLADAYLGVDSDNAPFKIGQVPPYPEEYHDAAINYAVYRFFAMRKDTDSAAMYKTLFENALDHYKTIYGNKTVSTVINPGKTRMPTITDVFGNATLIEGN